MGIKQFSGVWVKLEDRILFRVNTKELTEYRFWFTSLILKDMRSLCDQNIKKIYSTKDLRLNSSRRELIKTRVRKNLHQTTFDSGYAFPLGEKPSLVKSVALLVDLDGKKTTLQFETFNQKKIDLKLSVDLLIVLNTLLDQLEITSGWAHRGQESPADADVNEVEDRATCPSRKILH